MEGGVSGKEGLKKAGGVMYHTERLQKVLEVFG